MSTEAQLKAISNSELASGNQIPALKHRTVNNAIIEEMYDAQSRADVLAGVQTAVSISSGDQVLVIRSGQAYLLDSSEFGFVDALADLTDVSIPTPANDQVLAYNTTTSKWEAKDVNTLTSVVSISGTATTNALTKFTGTSSIGNSIISDNGTTVTIGGNLNVDNNLTVGTINSGTSSDFVKGDGSLDSTTYQDTTEKDQANGYAPLDSGAKIPLANLPDSILGQVSYQGTWAASTNTPTLANPPASTTKGEYYVASDDGTQFGIDFQVGDWIISNGSAWEKVDNTDAVTSVFGRTGPVIANAGDYDLYYVNLDGDQTITGEKTFSGDSLLIADAGNGLKGRFKNTSINSAQDSGYATFGFNGSNNLFFTKATSANFNGGVFAWDNNDAIRTYTLQDASGTLAFTSDLTDFVTLDTAQTISAAKTFTNTGSANTVVINHTSGSAGIALDITKSANGEGLKVNKTSGTGNAATIIGTLEATDLVGGSATITGNLAVDTDTLFVDSSNNRVGIGTSSPSNTLTINDEGYQIAVIDESSGNISEILSSNNAMGFFADRANAIADSTMLFSVDGSERMRIDSSGATSFAGSSSLSSAVASIQHLSSNGYLYIRGGTGGLIIGDDGTDSRIQIENNSNIRFETAGSEAMRIDSSGNVGIGTDSPSAKLDVNGDLLVNGVIKGNVDTFTPNDQLIFQLNASSAAQFVDSSGSGTIMYLEEATKNASFLGNVGIGTSSPVARLSTRGASNTSADYSFEAANSSGNSLFIVRNDGNVGIGTASPSVKLEVSGSVKLSDSLFIEGVTPRLYLTPDSTTGFSEIRFGDSTDTDSGEIQYSNSDDSMAFRTAASERMRITSSGFLKSSNNGTYNSSTGTYHELKSDVAGVTLYCYNTNANSDGIFSRVDASNTSNWVFKGFAGGADRVIIYSNGNIVNDNNSYGAISDSKLKENIVDASPKLDDLLQVKVRNFNYIGDDKKQLGVVAQELEEVFPSMIDESPDFEEKEVTDEEGNVTTQRVDLGTTTKSVKYSVFVPMLIKAMQEQQEIINDMKAEIETLKQQING